MAKKGKEHIDNYVLLYHEMLNSSAWTAISEGAIWLYIELKKQFNYKKGGNNYLILPYSKVAWRMSRGTYCQKIQELIRYGFIRIVEPGGLPKRPTIFATSEGWKKKSIEIVDKEGREAIRSGLSKKPSSRNNIRNLKGRRRWER